MLDADRPIQSRSEDKLGRAVFATYLARCIMDHQSAQSLVIGLAGAAGSGKTSLINLTLEELIEASNHLLDAEKPIILNFSPWSYSGQDQLIYSFFRRLSSAIRSADYFADDARDTIINLLELYISYFTHKPVPRSLQPKYTWWDRLFKGQWRKNPMVGWASGRDLTQVKAELNHLLAAQKHKLIIFIDNISRINATEVRQIFQIVKSMGDFSNSVYVLAYDPHYVISALNGTSGTDGPLSLEKMVQLPFTVPAIAKEDIENVLLSRLARVVEHAPEESWNKAYWADVYYSTLKYFFNDCRDITRYVNTLSFSFPRVKEIVNPVDFFAMTAIEVFEPRVFAGIRDNKDLFTDLVEQVAVLNQKKLAEDKGRCDEIFNRAERLPPEILQLLFIHLFPRLRKIYFPATPYYYSEKLARKQKRICTMDLFEVYFRLLLPTGEMSLAELTSILSLAQDEAGFALALMRLNQDERIEKFLNVMDSFGVYRIRETDIGHVLTALIDSGDLFPEGQNTLLNFNTALKLHRIIHQLLQRLPDQNARLVVMSRAIQKAVNSLYIIIHELNQQNHQAENEENDLPLEHRDFSPQQLETLRQLTIKNIALWASSGRLITHPKLIPILYAWKNWGDETACRTFVAACMEDDRSLLAFLTRALEKPVQQTMAKLVADTTWGDSLHHISDFIPVESLIGRTKRLFASTSFETLSEPEQVAILIFLDLVKPDTIKIIPKTTA